MKIAILTHPLVSNYGGILQNYALQQVLKNLGHQPETFDYRFDIGFIVIIKRRLKALTDFLLGKGKRLRYSPNSNEDAIIRKYIVTFVKKYMDVRDIYSLQNLNPDTIKDFGAIIVGSDQVWRAPMVSNIESFYLSGVNKSNIKKIAYAASFGVDKWEYTEKQTQKCKELAQLFDVITCREKNGVLLCKQYLNSDASFVLDPTLLLNKESYIQLIKNVRIQPTGQQLFTYILDMTPQKRQIIDQIARTLNLEVNEIRATKQYRQVKASDIEECVIPSIESWLSGFNEADFVITDSFHGTVFSIIFEKQFLTLGNSYRGNSRFFSLLQTFDLENRLVNNITEAKAIISNLVDYSNVNKIREEWIRNSISLINKSLD